MKRARGAMVFAIIGTIVMWAPILFMIVLSVIGSIQRGMFLFDYLMPAELFYVNIVGGILLLIGANLSKTCVKRIAWTLGGGLLALAGSMLYANWSGLAHGTTEIGGIEWAITLGLLIIYDLSTLLLAIMGISLVSKIRKQK